MTLIWIIVLGLLIGAVLGGLGGGGAILTVPALVYVIGQRAQDATTSSLVIVGLTAVVGVFSYVASHRVRWKMGIVFGVVGIPATWLGSFLNHRVDENLLLLGFSALMLAAAAMVGDGAKPANATGASRSSSATATREGNPRPPAPVAVMERTDTETASGARPAALVVVATALAVSFLTGFFGVGGGFVIVPALVLALRLPMQQAVGTSLMIVALNSGTSLVARAGTAHFDWGVIVPFTIAAMAATLAGKQVADRLPARKLKLGFAVLLVLVAGYTAWQSIDGLAGSEPAQTSTTSAASSPAIAEPADVEAALDAGSVAIDIRTPRASPMAIWTVNIPDPARALRELHRVLRPGGRFHFLEHGLSPEPHRPLATPAQRGTAARRRRLQPRPADRPDRRRRRVRDPGHEHRPDARTTTDPTVGTSVPRRRNQTSVSVSP